MKDTTPEGIIGYVVVSLPDRGVWQGFFVHPAYRERGELMMATFREAMASAGQQPLPGEGGMGGLPHLATAEQPAVATLSAVLAALVDRGSADGQPEGLRAAAMLETVGGAAFALRQLVDRPWLMVEGTKDHLRGGHLTRIQVIEADDVHMAREAMVRELQHRRVNREVGQSFEKLMRDLQRRAGKR